MHTYMHKDCPGCAELRDELIRSLRPTAPRWRLFLQRISAAVSRRQRISAAEDISKNGRNGGVGMS